jgi:hypothetical protein
VLEVWVNGANLLDARLHFRQRWQETIPLEGSSREAERVLVELRLRPGSDVRAVWSMPLATGFAVREVSLVSCGSSLGSAGQDHSSARTRERHGAGA